MTLEQKQIALGLQACIMLPGSFDKRISKKWADMVKETPDRDMTAEGWNYMRHLLYKYRNQLGAIYESNKTLARNIKLEKKFNWV